MSIRVHLQDSEGSGSRFDVRSATLRTGPAIIQFTDRNYLWFPFASLELRHTGDTRHFGIGEGFASMEDQCLSVVTTRYLEGRGRQDNPDDHNGPRCAVCEKPLDTPLHCLHIDGETIELCCPHCAETFRRACKLVRRIDRDGGNQTPPEPGNCGSLPEG